MALSETREELATQDLLRVIGGISTAEGYNTTVAQVGYWTEFGFHPDYASSPAVNNGCVLSESLVEPVESPIPDTYDYWQHYECVFFATEPQESLWRVRRRLKVFRADLVKAINLDITRGGNCHDTLVTDWEFIADVQGLPAVVVNFRCRIRESMTDPLITR